MSIEPQCIYCNAIDKARCKTQEEADGCKAFQRLRALKNEARERAPASRRITQTPGPQSNHNFAAQFSVDLSGSKRVSISSHQGGVPDRYTMKLDGREGQIAEIVLTQFDLDTMSGLLVQMQNYMKTTKGTR